MTNIPIFPTLDGWAAIVLAAGRGTRMHSSVAKVLHSVAGVPMIRHVCDTARGGGVKHIVVVVAPGNETITTTAGEGVSTAIQSKPLGTGHAALAGISTASDSSHVIILNGDLPLLTAKTLAAAAKRHLETNATLTFVTSEVEDPSGYGRVTRNGTEVTGIVEEAETDDTTRTIREINVGLFIVRTQWLRDTLSHLDQHTTDEIYLTDIVAKAVTANEIVTTESLADINEAHQINDRVDLARAETLMGERIRERLMRGGVTIVDPSSTFVDANVEVGADTTLLPGVHLLGSTRLGANCHIGPNAVLRDVIAGDRVHISSSTIEESTLAEDVDIGPYCHVRPGSKLQQHVHLGNYVEVKSSRIGAHTQIGHFSYIGDADIGETVNIGAGTITANYDGTEKHQTEIGDGAFIGVDSILVAPLVVGARARTGAGAVVTHDVPPSTTVIGVPARIQPSKGEETGRG